MLRGRWFALYDDPEPFQWAPTLGGECYVAYQLHEQQYRERLFQWAPTLGGECYCCRRAIPVNAQPSRFNGHPPLGVNATLLWESGKISIERLMFQWAPTLGGECYQERLFTSRQHLKRPSFNGHPPLGVNATHWRRGGARCWARAIMFQWAPTLGGECYR